MASNYSFDIVSEFDSQEMVNTVDQTTREIKGRYDLKDTNSTDRKSTRLNSSHVKRSRMPSSA